MVVESEDNPNRLLLETKICKEDGFQKQQGMSCRRHISTILLTEQCRNSHCVDGTEQRRRYGFVVSRG